MISVAMLKNTSYIIYILVLNTGLQEWNVNLSAMSVEAVVEEIAHLAN